MKHSLSKLLFMLLIFFCVNCFADCNCPDGEIRFVTCPKTYVTADQIAFYDCGAGPFTTIQGNGTLLTNKSDPCLNPAGQGPNTYSKACLQSRIISSGCSTEGKWYLNGLPGTATAGVPLGDIDKWMHAQKHKADPADCYGSQ